MDRVNWSVVRNPPALPAPDALALCPPNHMQEFYCVDCALSCCSHCCVLHLNSTPVRHTAIPLADDIVRETERSTDLHNQLARLNGVLETRRESLERLSPESIAFLNGLPDYVRSLKDLHAKIEQVGTATAPSTPHELEPLNRLSDPRPLASTSANVTSLACSSRRDPTLPLLSPHSSPPAGHRPDNLLDELRSLRMKNNRLRELVAEVTDVLQPPDGELARLLMEAARVLLGPRATEG